MAGNSMNIALVTGGSRGIGRAVCLELAEKGYAVAVNYQSNKTKAEEVVTEITKNNGKALAVQADVGNKDDVTRMFKEVQDGLGGPVTHLVNNAGVIGKKVGLMDANEDDILADLDTVLKANTIGPMLCIREAAKSMSTKNGGKGGVVVNVSSGSAFIGSPLYYAMSKGALNSMQAGLVPELAEHGIRINSVSPGLTKTDMVPDDVIIANVSKIPMKRAGEASEIASVIVFLLSEGASYCSGANIRVGGGRPMGGTQ
eukprot:m.12601 g.12601  ORF g.12601 m.12601 type:complete len:257 (+) comp4680_c0_seq1:134-904(+)